jgi:hypothetical protein
LGEGLVGEMSIESNDDWFSGNCPTCEQGYQGAERFLPGTTIERAAREMAAKSERTGQFKLGVFNDAPLVGGPGLGVGDIIDLWIETRRRMADRKSLGEGQRSAALQRLVDPPPTMPSQK